MMVRSYQMLVFAIVIEEQPILNNDNIQINKQTKKKLMLFTSNGLIPSRPIFQSIYLFVCSFLTFATPLRLSFFCLHFLPIEQLKLKS